MTQSTRRKTVEPSPWAKGMADRVGQAVRARRTELKMSAQALADRCSEIGYPIVRNTVANLENGRKNEVSLAEVMILAEALRVPPVQLIYPNVPEGETEYLPGRTTLSWHALKWFTGETPFRGQLAAEDAPEYHLSLMRELDALNVEYVELTDQNAKARADLDDLILRYANLVAENGEDVKLSKEDFEKDRRHAEMFAERVESRLERMKNSDRMLRRAIRDAGFTVTVREDQ